MTRKFMLFLMFFFFYPAFGNSEDRFGKYEDTPIQVQFCGDGRHVRLLKTLIYTDPSGAKWEAPTGAIVDGASIPQWAWSIIGGPFEGKYRDASIIHDVACDSQSRPWEYVHLAFYYAMLASGVDETKAKVMYAAVYHYGPRWAIHANTWKPPIRTIGEFACDKVADAAALNDRMRANNKPPKESYSKAGNENESYRIKHKMDKVRDSKADAKADPNPASTAAEYPTRHPSETVLAEMDNSDATMPPEFKQLKKKIEAHPKNYDIGRLQKEADRLP